jgi:hypothetical protein
MYQSYTSSFQQPVFCSPDLEAGSDDDDDDDEGSDVLAMLIPVASVSKFKPSAAQCVGSFPKSMQVLAIDHRLPLLSS